ncbi:hypothetical protein F383_11611 [Gossypium arboreum]|uniref:Uncharacterized protein n=1 Tax=Gossypium arboreum TaxID=29729 RepID=A0A0B0PSF1_GOSAR|nr:hypothetical protein F383_11611 [Gossypium arboreum]
MFIFRENLTEVKPCFPYILRFCLYKVIEKRG